MNSYANKDLFLYGELLGAPYGTNTFSGYLNYFNAVTDSNTSDNTRYNVVNNQMSNINSGYNYNTGAGNCVLWAESHDTYMNSGGASQNVSNEDIARTWAVVGSRNDSTSLFFARPKNNTTATSDTTWKSLTVSEVNKFKNLFDGQSEFLSTQGNTFYNERGTKGVVIAVKNGGEVRLPAHKIADGTYTDHVSDTSFTVANGMISGTVGETGVAVVYNADDTSSSSSGSGTVDTSTLYLKPNTGENSWSAGGERYAMYLFGDGEAWSSMTDLDSDGIYSGTIPAGSFTHVIFCRMNGSAGENNWDNRWCQTDNLVLNPSINNLFTIDDNVTQDTYRATGSWSSYTPSGSSSSSHTHDFGEPSWSWSADYSSAVATFNCTGADCTESFSFTDSNTTLSQSSISKCYTAKVTVNGREYTGKKYVDFSGRIYLKPNSWKLDDTRFAAYFFGSSNNNKWVSMSEVNGTGGAYYCADIPDGDWTNVIFCRMKENTSNDWDNRYDDDDVDRRESQTNDLEPSGGNCYEITSSGVYQATGSWSEYTDNSILYSTSGGETINLTGKIDRDAADTVLQNIPNTFKNLEILGVQKKSVITDKKAVRYVAVINNAIAQDAQDYGFIAVGSSTKAEARENITELSLDTANDKNVFSCKPNGVGTDNNVSGDYGKYSAVTNYKYVTLAINDIKDKAVAVKFYVKNAGGNVYYADYTDKTGTMYNNCSTDWSSLEVQ